MKKVSQKSKIFLLLGIILIPVFMFSFIFTTKINASKLVLLEQNQVINKTYFASGDVLDVRGTINGDAFLAGSNITFSGNVNGNLFVAGNTINLTGKVNGMIFSAGNVLTINSEGVNSLFAAGNLITVNSKISKNSYVAGSSVTITNNSEIGQDLFIGASVVNLDANVKRDLSLDSSSTFFGQNAKIGNDLEVASSMQTNANLQSITGGKITITQSQENNSSKEYIASFKAKIFEKLTIGLFSVLIIGLLLIKFFNKSLIKINKDSEKNFGKNLLKGLLFSIGVPFLAIILLITIIGIKLSFLTIGIYSIVMFLSSVVGSIFIGDVFLKKLMRQKTPSLYLALLVGSLIFIILTIIPFVGWIFGAIIILVSLGSLINFKSEIIKILDKKA